MAKSKKIIVFLVLIFTLCVSFAFGCGNSVYFEKDEYVVSSGDKVVANGNATYEIVGDIPNGVSVSSDGVFTITDDAINGCQVVLGAVKNGKVVDTAVCQIIVTTIKPVLTILNLSNYIVDGEVIEAIATPVYSVTYGLKENYLGITINEVSGKVSYTDKVSDGVPFTVIISSKGAVEERTFYTAVSDMIVSSESVLFCEKNGTESVSLELNFPQADLIEQGVLGVSFAKEKASDGDYSFDKETCTVTLKQSLLSRLKSGENKVKIATAKNTVTITVKKAIYIATAQDLVNIGKDKESLSGYYVQVSNIDLTTYLSNSNEGWNPIGTYKDVTDGTATEMAFNGIYDGNGKTISGFYISRNDTVAYNSGLFGYVANNAVISNLTLKCSTKYSHNVRSYSGILAGVNCGIIKDCAVYGDINAEGCKTVGCFVGRNEGDIKNCYSVGEVVASESYGAFCGMNMGKVIDCYAVSKKSLSAIGVGGRNEVLFSSENEMLEKGNFATWESWELTENGLIIKGHEIYYPLRSLSVINERVEYIKGMKFDLAITGNPADLTGYSFAYEIRKGETEYISVENGRVDLTNAKLGDYTIRVYCGEIYADYNFSVKENAEGIIAIYTVQDFMEFKANTKNYDKTVVLMQDLDFGNIETTSIGFYREEDEDFSGVFSGDFDGNGKTIKNLIIVRNDYDGDYGEGNYDTNVFHNAYYNVGLFCCVTGTVKNLTIENVKVQPTFNGEGCGNMIGVVCGTLFGVVEDCKINNCSYYGKDEETLKTGIVCGANYGSIVGVLVDGNEYGDM